MNEGAKAIQVTLIVDQLYSNIKNRIIRSRSAREFMYITSR